MPIPIPKEQQTRLEFYREVLFSDRAPEFEDALSIYKSINEGMSFLRKVDPIIRHYLIQSTTNVLWYDFLCYLESNDQCMFSFSILERKHIQVKGYPRDIFEHGGCFLLSLIYLSEKRFVQSGPILFILPILPNLIFGVDKEFLMFNEFF